mmetsp:Transcript_2605/g.6165  ORF Transcript_2605/g.6165 Transcript_2605/m.6165 type:complete len:128 (+) Transcript_2605:83-466(+)
MQAAARAISSAILTHARLPPATGLAATSVNSGNLAVLGLRHFSEGLDKSEVTERILNVVKNFEKVDPAKVTPTANFQKDLGLDSLDTVEVVMAFEEEFAIEIPDADADKIASISDAVAFVSSHPMAK